MRTVTFLSFKLLVTQYIVTQMAHRIKVFANTAEVYSPQAKRRGKTVLTAIH